MALFVRRLERDDKLIAELEAEVTAFLREVAETVDALTAAYDPQPRALSLVEAG